MLRRRRALVASPEVAPVPRRSREQCRPVKLQQPLRAPPETKGRLRSPQPRSGVGSRAHCAGQVGLVGVAGSRLRCRSRPPSRRLRSAHARTRWSARACMRAARLPRRDAATQGAAEGVHRWVRNRRVSRGGTLWPDMLAGQNTRLPPSLVSSSATVDPDIPSRMRRTCVARRLGVLPDSDHRPGPDAPANAAGCTACTRSAMRSAARRNAPFLGCSSLAQSSSPTTPRRST